MDMCQYEQGVLIQKVLTDTPPAPPMSALECLNLNITVPDLQEKKCLPVMVFIHGGGYIMGANWWPQYDPVRFVKLSADAGMPVIAINIKYGSCPTCLIDLAYVHYAATVLEYWET